MMVCFVRMHVTLLLWFGFYLFFYSTGNIFLTVQPKSLFLVLRLSEVFREMRHQP